MEMLHFALLFCEIGLNCADIQLAYQILYENNTYLFLKCNLYGK